MSYRNNYQRRISREFLAGVGCFLANIFISHFILSILLSVCGILLVFGLLKLPRKFDFFVIVGIVWFVGSFLFNGLFASIAMIVGVGFIFWKSLPIKSITKKLKIKKRKNLCKNNKRKFKKLKGI